VSISPFHYDFRPIKRGFDFDFQFYWFDETGNGLNLNGSQVSINLWDKKRENVITSMSTAYLAMNPGHTIHALNKTKTTLLVAGDYFYELALIEPDGSTYCYMDGVMPFVDFTPPP
jgi:hypothetical protein